MQNQEMSANTYAGYRQRESMTDRQDHVADYRVFGADKLIPSRSRSSFWRLTFGIFSLLTWLGACLFTFIAYYVIEVSLSSGRSATQIGLIVFLLLFTFFIVCANVLLNRKR